MNTWAAGAESLRASLARPASTPDNWQPHQSFGLVLPFTIQHAASFLLLINVEKERGDGSSAAFIFVVPVPGA